MLQCKEAWEMDNPEKLEQAELKKDRGSVFFKVVPPNTQHLEATYRKQNKLFTNY